MFKVCFKYIAHSNVMVASTKRITRARRCVYHPDAATTLTQSGSRAHDRRVRTRVLWRRVVTGRELRARAPGRRRCPWGRGWWCRRRGRRGDRRRAESAPQHHGSTQVSLDTRPLYRCTWLGLVPMGKQSCILITATGLARSIPRGESLIVKRGQKWLIEGHLIK